MVFTQKKKNGWPMEVKIKSKNNKQNNPGVCGSRKKEKDFCKGSIKPDDKMKEFSCEK